MDELETGRSFLKSIRMNNLEPGLQREVLALADELGYERTIKAESSLAFLFELYGTERVKRDRAKLRRAESLILKLATLHHETVQRTIREEAKRKERLPFATAGGVVGRVALTVSERMRKLFHSLGIDDEKIMVRALENFGEKEVENRIELALASRLGEEVLKALFGAHPELILESDFSFRIETIEQKKDILDSAKSTRPLPQELDYGQRPDALLLDFADIARLLSLKGQEVEQPEMIEIPKVKYRSKPMHPLDFIKVVREFGFELVREATHGWLYKNERTGAMMCIQKPHRSQFELNGSTIKKKLTEASIPLDKFEEIRQKLRL